MKIIFSIALITFFSTTSERPEIDAANQDGMHEQKITQKAKNPSKRPNGIYRYDRVSKKNSIA